MQKQEILELIKASRAGMRVVNLMCYYVSSLLMFATRLLKLSKVILNRS